MENKNKIKFQILKIGSILLLLALVFVLAQIVLAKNGNGGFTVKDSYIEVIETDYPQNISLVKKENGQEEIAGQVKIVDQYLISEIPENEFLDEYSYLKEGFQDLSISLETDQPLFDKENFYYSSSLLDKIKVLFDLTTLPECRITKEVDKSASVQTELDLKNLKIGTYYEELGIENNELRIKQTLTFTNESDQDLNLALLLKNQVEANKIYWNGKEYFITENARRFVNPDKISFEIENGKSFYDFSDIPDEFEPELWAKNKDGQNFLILSLNVSISAGETKTIDPTYGVEITILNVHSHPQVGDNWTVSFETKGTANLTITPDDQESIDDLDFVSLNCGDEQRTPQILEDDVIFYPNWSCEETGEIVHLVNVARPHTLKFQFGNRIAYAYNNPDESTYNFVGVTQESNNYYAYEKSGAATFTSQDDIEDSEATNTDYDNIESTNDVRWTTDGASTDGHYDSQLYKFYINEDESSVTQLDFKWEGYGETHGTGYPTGFYAWNYNTSAWDLLQEVTFTATTDQNLTGSKTTDAGNYIDTDKEVTLMVKTKKYVFACGDDVTFTYRGSEVTYGTVSSQGECWLDRNLGASQVATAYNDANAYGDLFQWGRLDDNHQDRSSGLTTTLSSSDDPGHSNFIYGMGSPYDWRSPQNDNLWQGDGGINDPCPAGWRIPTETELDTERASWSSQDYNGAYASPLKLTAGGYRSYSNGSLNYVGSHGYYWSSTVSGPYARHLHFRSSGALMDSNNRAHGFSVRCVKD